MWGSCRRRTSLMYLWCVLHTPLGRTGGRWQTTSFAPTWILSARGPAVRRGSIAAGRGPAARGCHGPRFWGGADVRAAGVCRAVCRGRAARCYSITAALAPAMASPATWSARDGTSRIGRLRSPPRVGSRGRYRTDCPLGDVLQRRPRDCGGRRGPGHCGHWLPGSVGGRDRHGTKVGGGGALRSLAAGLRDWSARSPFAGHTVFRSMASRGRWPAWPGRRGGRLLGDRAAGLHLAKCVSGPVPGVDHVLSAAVGCRSGALPRAVILARKTRSARRARSQDGPADAGRDASGGAGRAFFGLPGPTFETVVAAEIDFLKRTLSFGRVVTIRKNVRG